MLVSLAATAFLGLTLSGCSSGEGDPVDPGAQATQDMTPRALAAAVAAQLPDADLVAAHPDRGGDADETDALRVDLTFKTADGRRSSITVVATDDVGDFPGRHPCQEHKDILDGCVETNGPDGSRSILLWQEKAPEETGIIDAVSVRPEAMVWAEYHGHVKVTGDPRDLDLAISPDDLLAAVSDPAIGLTASPDQLKAGDQLAVWQDVGP